jgi:TolB-like protein/tetratricopeptide (TPR) repeat protein
MPGVSNAVFLSYASEDAEAAEHIATALRAAGIQVWFDQSELRGGDAWDRQIRQQIHDCRLFIAMISAQTEARDEGYFRREWRLAVERAGDMAEGKAFLVPVVIDGTTERGAAVPDKFHEHQWTRLPDGETAPAFVARVQKLLVPDAPTRVAAPAPTPSGSTKAPASKRSLHPNWPSNTVLWVISALLAVGLAYLIVDSLRRPQHSQATPASQKAASSTSAAPATAAAFNPPPHSIAVLPFVNMSGDKEQDYFSDGLSEELLNSLSRINELQVAARTSSFYFKGEHADLSTIAHKLNVASVLEGSVRRSGNTIRVTAQLNNAVTGFHLWSQTYDRDLSNVLQLQTEIANAVASALRVTLLGDVAGKIELGGTHNPAAFDAYLRGMKAFARGDDKGRHDAISAFTEATRLDPNYALAFAERSMACSAYAAEYATGAAKKEFFGRALADARQALAVAPELGEGQLALALYLEIGLDFARASEAYQRARALALGNAEVLRLSGRFDVWMGHVDLGLGALRRAVVLDPLSPRSHVVLSQGLFYSRRYAEAVTAATDAISLDPDLRAAHKFLGLAYYGLGDLERARDSCEAKPNYWGTQWCLAVIYDKLGRHAEAQALVAKLTVALGDAAAYQYATIYAQWGDTSQSLEWLQKARNLHDSGLSNLKTDPLLDPVRREARFRAIMRELKFPE